MSYKTLSLSIGVLILFSFIIIEQSERIHELRQQISIKREENRSLYKKLDEKIAQMEGFVRYGGFMEMPIPPVDETVHLLILQSINGGAVFSTKNPPNTDLLNTRFYVAYDMDNHKFLALQDSHGGFGGKDFMLFITTNPNGTRTFRPIVGPESIELGKQFGLGFGPDRR